MLTLDQPNYYAHRASEYEKVYQIPAEQPDLAKLYGQAQAIFKNKKVLEIACGTGIWTQAIAETAHAVLATDINEPMLHIARQKEYPRQNMVFETGDMYDLQVHDRPFDALFGGFIWSHVSRHELENWLDSLHRLLEPGSRVVFVEAASSPEKAPPFLKLTSTGTLSRSDNSKTAASIWS
ncbi:MAG: class I SAM-dependent methyltransferase [Saprospiraceae bacterium]